MDPERERIQADLRGVIEGEVRCDDLTLQMYASDASIYEIKPLGVVRPRSVADVVACTQYATEHGISLHPRGAGSGLAGESLGPGLVIDFSYRMRRLLDVDQETVRVQSGMPLAQLNRRLVATGRKIGPDPANLAATTVGSVVALDASGSHWLKYGSARPHVRSVQVVLADGRCVEFDQQHPLGSDSRTPQQSQVASLARRVADLAQRHDRTIQDKRPKALVSRCGYHLYDVVQNDYVNLASLMVGSEGTLGLITEVTLDTVPVPAHRGVALLLFERLELAARAALELRRFSPWACDLLDRRLMRLAGESDIRFQLLVPSVTEASLLVEVQDDDPAEVRGRLQQMIQFIQRKKKLAFDAKLALEEEEVAFYWKLAEHVVPTLYRLKGQTRALPFVEDVAVPPAQLPRFLLTLQNVLKQHQVTASLFAHAGHGQLHIRPFLDLANLSHVHRLHLLAKDLYQEVTAIGGTISGEHGTGLSRTWFMREQFGTLYDVFREVKTLFDPRGILNPGKVVSQQAQPITHNLRPVTENRPASTAVSPSADPAGLSEPLVELQLSWDVSAMALAARSCNGCGACYTQSPDQRMCPIFRHQPSEEASPRAKANLMRGVITGRLEWTSITSDAMKQIADLCVNCHQCRLECPARVDIPKLMTECKAQYVATNGLRFSDWLLGRVDLLCSWASRFSSLANWALGNLRVRWLLEKVAGIAQGRKLPRLAGRSFFRTATRRRLSRPTRAPGKKVVYFVDLYANYFDVELANALVSILEHHGISVFVPAGQLFSAMPMIAQGSVERARPIARRNVALLADAIRQGYHVVATEPSAALCLTYEYPQLLDDEDSRLVAAHTSEACDYFWQLHLAGKLELDLKPLSTAVAYHEPCHVRALGTQHAGEQLLRLIPGLSVQRIERGCSGMAGTFGLNKANYLSSLRMGLGLITEMRDSAVQVGATECSACKLQMQQGTPKPTVHPLKLLAASYGLAPNPIHDMRRGRLRR